MRSARLNVLLKPAIWITPTRAAKAPQKKKKMAAPTSFAAKAGTVAFFVLVLCANLAAWATCHCLQLAYTSGLLRLLTSRFKGSSGAAKTVVVDDDTYARQVKEGLAIVATRHFWWLALLLARPWVSPLHCRHEPRPGRPAQGLPTLPPREAAANEDLRPRLRLRRRRRRRRRPRTRSC